MKTQKSNELTSNDLEVLRERVDGVDKKILELINERLEIAEEIALVKKAEHHPIYFPARQERLLQQLVADNEGKLSERALRAIFREVISAALTHQKQLTIGYLGKKGNNARWAARQNFGAASDYMRFESVEGLFDAVKEGEVDYGIFPMKGEGPVWDVFHGEKVKVIAEVKLSEEESGELLRFFVIGPKSVDPAEGWEFRSLALLSLSKDLTVEGVLRVFEKYGLNVIEVQALETGSKKRKNLYFVELEGHWNDTQQQLAFIDLKEMCPYFQWVGSYPLHGE